MGIGESKHLLAVVRQLSSGLDEGGHETGLCPAEPRADQAALWPQLDAEQERLVADLRRALWELASVARPRRLAPDEQRTVALALDGAEMVMRAELACGREAALEAHLPGFAFIVALPGLGRVRALELSRQTEALLDGR